MSYLLITTGYTHSGKTTFGKKLAARLGPDAKFIHVDNDAVDEYLKDNFGNLRSDPAILATRTPTNPDLRLLIPQQIAAYALKEHYNVIATASHPRRAIRGAYQDIARQNGAKVVLVTFDISDDQLRERIQQDQRDPAILDTSFTKSASFLDLLDRQHGMFEFPEADELAKYDQVITVRPDTADAALGQAVELCHAAEAADWPAA
jgi:predicted kinase